MTHVGTSKSTTLVPTTTSSNDIGMDGELIDLYNIY